MFSKNVYHLHLIELLLTQRSIRSDPPLGNHPLLSGKKEITALQMKSESKYDSKPAFSSNVYYIKCERVCDISTVAYAHYLLPLSFVPADCYVVPVFLVG